MQKNKNKLVAILLLVLATVFVFSFLIVPIYANYKSTSEEIATLQYQLLRFKTISRKTEGLTSKLVELEAFNENHDYYFSNNKAALASAELQGIIKEILHRQNAKIISTQAVTSGNFDKRQVKVAVHCRADIISLRNLLYAIETHIPILVIDKFNIGRGYRTTYSDQVKEDANEVLDIRFDISGFMSSKIENNS